MHSALGLSVRSRGCGGPYPEACGLRHLAFAAADLDAAAHLQSHGAAAEPVRVDEYTGKRFTFFADADGPPLELYELRLAPNMRVAAQNPKVLLKTWLSKTLFGMMVPGRCQPARPAGWEAVLRPPGHS